MVCLYLFTLRTHLYRVVFKFHIWINNTGQ